jgi:uncharacterized protein
VSQEVTKSEPQWGNPGALGLAGFGFTTLLLAVHNLGGMDNTMALAYGLFWGGLAQVIAGVIDGKRGDTFGLTAFTSYGVFWIGLATAVLFLKPDSNGLAWTMIMFGIFTFIMTIGTLKLTLMHFFVFGTLTILFFLVAAVFFGSLSAKVAGVEGLLPGAGAVYGSAAIIINGKFGRTILPLGRVLK